jgi:hemerythrin superfamily protein
MTDTHYTHSPNVLETNTDVISLLKADHEKVKDLFADFEKADSSEAKKKLVAEICSELRIHTQLEEEIFYPAFKAANLDKKLVPEACVEHETIRDLIDQLEGAEPNGESFEAKVKVLSEYVKHHVKEEHSEMFIKEKTDSLDLNELGALMIERKADLLAERE